MEVTLNTSTSDRIKVLSDEGHWTGDTLHSLLAAQVARAPEQLAVADQPDRGEWCAQEALRLTFSELERASDLLAVSLLDKGVDEHARVMVQLPNIAELVVCFLAVSKLGAVISPIPVQYGPHEILTLSKTAEATAFISCSHFKGQDLAQSARDVLAEIPVWTIESDLPCRGGEVDEAAASRLRDHGSTIVDGAHRTISICWTSGTTGTPKGVPRSHAMWLATARATAEAGGYQQDERLLNPFPLVNMAAVGGFLFACIDLGCSLILHHPLEPAIYLKQLQDERIDFTIAPPALLNMLAAKPEFWQSFDFSSLRAVGSGSAPLSPSMIATFEQVYKKPIINFYGSNEGVALFATPSTAPTPDLRASYFPRFGVEGFDWQERSAAWIKTKVIDLDSGSEVTEAGGVGELCVAGATVFDGYLGTDNSDLYTADGYFRSGDVVEIGGENNAYYRIVGRSKDIINRGGMKISPAELDTLLEGHPDLAEVAVCAYPDERLGERICVCVVASADAEPPSLASICDWLGDKGVAVFKLPERLAVFDALPRNPMGKIVRNELQTAVTSMEQES